MLKNAERVERFLGELADRGIPCRKKKKAKTSSIARYIYYFDSRPFPSSLDYSSQKVLLCYSLTVCLFFKILFSQLLIMCIFEHVITCTHTEYLSIKTEGSKECFHMFIKLFLSLTIFFTYVKLIQKAIQYSFHY